MSRPLVEVENLTKHFNARAGFFDFNSQVVRAVNGVSLEVFEGETLALVGESGCGKSTLARMLLRLIEPTGGTIHFQGENVSELHGNQLHAFRKNAQIIFQDPVAALNPRKTVYQILKDPLLLHGIADRATLSETIHQLLESVGLTPASAYVNRTPGEFSGGQRQRIVIARAIALDPILIVADEPVSALDISIRAQILELLKTLQQEKNITFVFITHDLAVVRSIAQRVAIMYLGQIVELGSVDEIFENPSHPYTQALLRSTPIPDPIEASKREKIVLSGEIPSASAPPPGCHFHPRCPFAFERCRVDPPFLRKLNANRQVACHLFDGDEHNMADLVSIPLRSGSLEEDSAL